MGELDDKSREFRAVVATSPPVQRRDAKGPFLEILVPAGLECRDSNDFPQLTNHRSAARETVGRASGLVINGPSVSATLCLGQADDIKPIFQRVKDGVIRHASGR
ncbi:hypothetical protein Q9299_08715 [Gemmobacter fulvus]|uniref:hypothetical protein n=1 Tax=Gemmobacter fulvus TaxID=2840474 RepID=UPI002796450E|nr:hypothetical protein [Gemmobacter fulvus]MDQ1848367.1 hypothetical protein [Gemmobacter fulvus]